MTGKNRISNPRTGGGDLGTSNLVSGHRIRKSSSICTLQNELQDLRNLIKLLLVFLEEDYPEIIKKYETEKNYLFKITNEIANNISASAYFKFENEKFTIEDSAFMDLVTQIETLTKSHVDCPEFFIPNQKITIFVDIVTTQIRRVENTFWICIEDIYNQYDKQELNPKENIVVKSTAQFLNGFSDFMFLLNREIHYSLGFNSEYWNNK